MTPGPGIEPRPHWWEAIALITASPLLPKSLGIFVTKYSKHLIVVNFVALPRTRKRTISDHLTTSKLLLWKTVDGWAQENHC